MTCLTDQYRILIKTNYLQMDTYISNIDNIIVEAGLSQLEEQTTFLMAKEEKIQFYV